MSGTKRTPASTISHRLMIWYAKNQRKLPWRQSRNPYHIWVSEVMLQQTQVDTVIPYYHRFLSRFPTLESLAAASLQDVLKVWENLGYYSRARHLHHAAMQIVADRGGKIPGTYDGLIRLPGVGPYIAGAILSIAFGQRVPAVDGNIRRVISRLFFIPEPMDRITTQRQIHDLVEDMIPENAPEVFNQALMDFGATICTPGKPDCNKCPLQDMCMAREKGIQELLPVKKRRGALPHKDMTAGIVANGRGGILIVQRPLEGLLGGLWKFPGGERRQGESLRSALKRNTRDELGIEVTTKKAVISVKHAYTHFRITLHAFHCDWRGGEPRTLGCPGWRWVGRDRLKDLPFSKADRKIIDRLLLIGSNVDGLVKSPKPRHSGESRSPEVPEKTGFRLSPE